MNFCSTCFGRLANYNSGPIRDFAIPRVWHGARKLTGAETSSKIAKRKCEHGRDVAIFGLGNMFEVAEKEAAKKLRRKGVSVALIIRVGSTDGHRHARILRAQCGVVARLEDHVLHNGFVCAVMEHLHSQRSIHRSRGFGWPDDHRTRRGPAVAQKHGITATRWSKKFLPF